MSFTQLIYGGECSDFERAFAEGIGLVGSSVEEVRPEEDEEEAATRASASRRLKVQLKLMSMKSEQFERLEVIWNCLFFENNLKKVFSGSHICRSLVLCIGSLPRVTVMQV